tara:strand:+ start:3127 stop:4308 length:1182 start_codon:yes stop_codon:yes gene_type:complete
MPPKTPPHKPKQFTSSILEIDAPLFKNMSMHTLKKVFVSGCYDILHAGHLQFFAEAKALGNYLIVNFASTDVLLAHKKRASSLPDQHKKALLEAMEVIDEVFIGDDPDLGLNFKSNFLQTRPDILAVTEDDQYADIKKELCQSIGAAYIALPKTAPTFQPVSTTSLIQNIKAPLTVPVRVDFGGGWLDVPKHAIEGGFIVNCAVTPHVSKTDWPYEKKSGLGGSAAWAILNGHDGVKSELDLGVGWQDPAIINETGLCVWRSGERPTLHLKTNNDFLAGKMAIYYTGYDHDTPGNVDNLRDYQLIKQAGDIAYRAAAERSLPLLAEAVQTSYQMQLKECMKPLPPLEGAIANKYSGGGHGGYALYLFNSQEARDAIVKNNPEALAIEPYLKQP